MLERYPKLFSGLPVRTKNSEGWQIIAFPFMLCHLSEIFAELTNDVEGAGGQRVLGIKLSIVVVTEVRGLCLDRTYN